MESLVDLSLGTLQLWHSAMKRPCLPPPDNRTDISAYPQARDELKHVNFSRDNVRTPINLMPTSEATLQMIQKITNAKKEADMYAPSAELLTTISKWLYGQLHIYFPYYSKLLT